MLRSPSNGQFLHGDNCSPHKSNSATSSIILYSGQMHYFGCISALFSRSRALKSCGHRSTKASSTFLHNKPMPTPRKMLSPHWPVGSNSTIDSTAAQSNTTFSASSNYKLQHWISLENLANPNCYQCATTTTSTSTSRKSKPSVGSHKTNSQIVASCEHLPDCINSDSSSPAWHPVGVYDKSTSMASIAEANVVLNSNSKYLLTSDRSDRCLASSSTISRPQTLLQQFEHSVHSVQYEHSSSSNDVCLDVNRTTQVSSSIAGYKCLPRCFLPATLKSYRPVFIDRPKLYIYLLLMIITCHLQSPVHSSANIRAIEKRILDSIIGDGRYDSRIRPMGNVSVETRSGDGPAMVFVNLLIRSISRIDDVVMEYSVQVTFREQWVDNRLKFDNMNGQIRYLVLTDPMRVWRPDLFFKNEKEGHFHDIIMPNVLLRIYPEGGVLYSIRISLVLSCPMDLKYYPLDKQVCDIQMASYGYTTEDLMFVWKKEDPVQILSKLHLPRFTLEKYMTDYCTSKTNTGSYSCLKVELLFKREFSFYLIQIYIPCCMLVIVSWVSFWLDPNAIPARVSLGVTTLLTMATSISGINSSLPPVSYTKAIDVWTGVCLTFVFGALLEFALVNYASRSDAHRAAIKQQQAAFEAQRKWDLETAAALEGDHIDDRTAPAFAMRPLVRQHGGFNGEKMRACEIHMTMPKRNWCKRWLSKFPTRSKRIDVISRIFFPLMFALFNLVYWTTYLFREDKQDLLKM